MKTKLAKNFQRSTELRRIVLEKPELTVGELEKTWTQYKKLGPLPKRKSVENLLYNTKYVLRKRWKVTDLKKLQDLPMVAWAKKVLTSHPDWFGKFEKVQNFLAQDGIQMTAATFASAKAIWKKEYPEVAAELAATDSPDPNQLTGPRKGKRHKNGRRHHVEPVDQVKRAGDFYLSIEDELDKMIRNCDTIRDSKLASALRTARRMASVKIVQLA
jgi:hypothetical protein